MKWFKRRRRPAPVLEVVREPILNPSADMVRRAIETGLREGEPISMDVDTKGAGNCDYTVMVTFRHNSARAA